jgi:hypothetical protein
MQDEIAAVIAEEIRTTVVNAFQPYGQGFVDAATMLAWADRLSAASSSPGETRYRPESIGASHDDRSQPIGGPIPLNEAQEQAAREWAADGRLWTTQDTVEVNLRTFGRVVLKASASPHGPSSGEGCVCTVDDGLVREWVQKAREIAKSKGFELPPLPAPPQESSREET